VGIKTKVLVADEWVNGEELKFKAKNEDWNIYELEDGTTIKLKTVVTKIVRTEKYHPTRNDPVYQVSSHNIVEAEVPEKLKKRI